MFVRALNTSTIAFARHVDADNERLYLEVGDQAQGTKTMVPSQRLTLIFATESFLHLFQLLFVPMAYLRNLSTLSANTTIAIARKNNMTPRQMRL